MGVWFAYSLVTALTAGRRQDGRQLRSGVDGLTGNAARQRTRPPRHVRHRAQRKSRRRLRRCRAASHPGRSSSAGRAKCTCESKPHSAAGAPLQNQVLVPPTLLQLFGTTQPSTLGAGIFSYCRAASAKNPCEYGTSAWPKSPAAPLPRCAQSVVGRWVGVVDGVWIFLVPERPWALEVPKVLSWLA